MSSSGSVPRDVVRFWLDHPLLSAAIIEAGICAHPNKGESINSSSNNDHRDFLLLTSDIDQGTGVSPQASSIPCSTDDLVRRLASEPTPNVILPSLNFVSLCLSARKVLLRYDSSVRVYSRDLDPELIRIFKEASFDLSYDEDFSNFFLCLEDRESLLKILKGHRPAVVRARLSLLEELWIEENDLAVDLLLPGPFEGPCEYGYAFVVGVQDGVEPPPFDGTEFSPFGKLSWYRSRVAPCKIDGKCYGCRKVLWLIDDFANSD